MKTKLFCIVSLGLALATAHGQIIGNATSIVMSANGTDPYPSTIVVGGLSGNIASVTVSLRRITHTFPDDIDVLLVGPGGQNVLLLSDTGGSADIDSVTLTLMDGAPLLPDNTALSSGTYGPTNFGFGDTFTSPAPNGPYGSDLSVFSGTDGDGTWSLYVLDDANGNTGSISGGWFINFNVIPEPNATALLAAAALGCATRRRTKASGDGVNA